jgi:hypothetical protein
MALRHVLGWIEMKRRLPYFGKAKMQAFGISQALTTAALVDNLGIR